VAFTYLKVKSIKCLYLLPVVLVLVLFLFTSLRFRHVNGGMQKVTHRKQQKTETVGDCKPPPRPLSSPCVQFSKILWEIPGSVSWSWSRL